jgi:hypothetical protein
MIDFKSENIQLSGEGDSCRGSEEPLKRTGRYALT